MDRFAPARDRPAPVFMPDWFTKARDTIARRPGPAEPEPFERPCVCGETVRGERVAQAHEVPCPSCGREWFVLPRDPYPWPKPRSRKPPLWQRLRPRKSSAEMPAIDGDDGRPAAVPTSSTRSATAAAPPRPKNPPVRERLREGLTAAKQATREWVRKEARPIRLVLAGIVAVVAVTGVWLWHRARVDAASATVVRVVPQAEQALDARDFAAAERLFAEAVAAVDLLGAADETAARVRQRHRELVALNNLAGKTPYDLAAEAEARAANPDGWEEEFRAAYAGRWVIFDVPLGRPEPPTPLDPPDEENRRPGPRPEKVVRLDLPLTAGASPVRFEIDAAAFRDLTSPDRAIFAAQYDSWRLHREGDDRSVWVVRFRPDTAFLWASPDTYAALGFDPDDPAGTPRAVLDRQRNELGLPTDMNPKE